MSAGTRTGCEVRGCYAASLRDCGEGLEREHFITEKLLKRLGRSFSLRGMPWTDPMGTPKMTPKALAGKVLCGRHNGRLSPFDSVACKLFDVLKVWRSGRDVGWHTINGDCLERWAMKMIFGGVASGNLLGKDGQPAVKTVPPVEYLRMLFEDAPLSPGMGFYYNASPIAGNPVDLRVTFNTYPDDAPTADAGALFGITVTLLGFTFVMSLRSLGPEGITLRLRYRPLGFVFVDSSGERGRLRLEWSDAHSNDVILLRR